MIVFDEKEYAEQLLKKGFVTKHKNVYELFILAKYYFYINKNKNEVKDLLVKFCEKHLEHFNIDEWYKIINRTIQYANNSKLVTGKIVKISENELNTICKLKDIREQKLAFTMLVLYKFYNCKRFKITLKDLFDLSDLRTINSETKLKLLHSLNKKRLINIDTKRRRWVNFVDNEGKEKIIIKKFDDFIFHYLNYIGEGRFKYCEECGERLIRITNYRNKYCKLCFNKKEKERQKKKWHKYKHKYRK